MARAKELFLEAIERPLETRAQFVAEACAGDAALEREVLELLGYHSERDTRIDAAVGDLALLEALPERFPEPPPGLRILRLLGRGGMGSVWLADRVSDGELVAIKMLTAGVHSREMLGRFKREAEILRRLAHPGIARLLDAGVYRADYGEQPYLLLEYVHGETLTAYVAVQRLSVSARLGLLQQLAEAVSHAHANGVVHRDLKPENILVDGMGRVRVLDFGVARFVEGDGASLATRTGLMLGTPQYMSPEQVQAEPGGVGPACDVYALGVIGFELLGGRLPYDVRGQSLHRAVVTVLTVEPPRLGSLGAVLRGDLENIIAKALEKAPAERYPDAGAMAADLRRHLEGRPVSVRAPSRLKRLWRGIQQRRLMVPGVLVALVFAGIFLMPLIQQVRADGAWRGLFARMVNADDQVHDERHRTIPQIEEAQRQLLRCREEIPALPDRPFRHMAYAYLSARLGETHWILGDLRSDPAEFETASAEFLRARGNWQAPRSYAGLENMQAVRERFDGLPLSDIDGLVCMSYRELARYRRPAENYLLATVGSADAAAHLLARFGLSPPAPGNANPASALGWPDTIVTRPEYVYYCNDFGAAQCGYARAAQDSAHAASALRLAREARRFVHSITGADAATGSVFYCLGNAFLAHATIAHVPAELDSAQTQYETSLAYRGFERAHQFAETRRALAQVELERARIARAPAARARAANAAIAHLEGGRRALATARISLVTEYALLDLLRAEALMVKAEATPAWMPLDSCLAPLGEASSAFPREAYPVQGSWNDLLRAMHARIAWQRSRAAQDRDEALRLLNAARTLAASQDRELDARIAAERAQLAAGR